MIVYGIKNCDTIKKTIQFLKNNEIEFEFHDYKLKGITSQKLDQWIAQVGIEKIINKKGTTFKKLDPSIAAKSNDIEFFKDILIANSSIIKRPIIEKNNEIIMIGFNEEVYNSTKF